MFREVAPIVRGAYADLMGIVRDMWPMLLILSAVYVLCTMGWFTASAIVPTWIGRYVVRMLLFIGAAWVTTPYFIAFHRYVAFGEARWLPPLDRYGEAGRIYSAWAGFSVALWFAPIILREILDALMPLVGTMLILPLFIGVFIILARITTLLPAAALDPQNANWWAAWRDSSRKGGVFFWSTAGAAAPATILLLMVGRAAGQQTITALPFTVLAIIALLAMQLIPLAAATRLYRQKAQDAQAGRMSRFIHRRN